jgi:hypothetical protein
MSTDKRVVIVTATPSRLEMLLALLVQLGEQTLRPHVIELLLDGAWYGEALRDIAALTDWSPSFSDIAVMIHVNTWIIGEADRLGPPARWRHAVSHIDHGAPNTMVFTLDDDVSITALYLEECARIVTERGVVCSWTDRTELTPAYERTPLIAGRASAFYAHWLTGLLDDPRAKKHLVFGRQPDAFVSAFLRRRGIPIESPSHVGAGVVEFRDTPSVYLPADLTEADLTELTVIAEDT